MRNALPRSPDNSKKTSKSGKIGKSRFRKIFDWFSSFEFDHKVKAEYKFVMIFAVVVIVLVVIGIFVHLYRVFSG